MCSVVRIGRHLTSRSSRPRVVASAMCFTLRLHMSVAPPQGGLTQALGTVEAVSSASRNLEISAPLTCGPASHLLQPTLHSGFSCISSLRLQRALHSLRVTHSDFVTDRAFTRLRMLSPLHPSSASPMDGSSGALRQSGFGFGKLCGC
jgi:hypothetical protein